ncbi:MAG: branched-chain-amino-acid transaminase [Bacillota bacterium]|jgi:branched-chain amino acid aminotransferase
MERLIYIDGRHVPKSEAKVSVFDHGFLYGDGVFEGIRAYNSRVFHLDEHLERLYQSAKAIMLEVPLEPKEMEAVVLETLRLNNLKDAYIRLIVSRGAGDLGLDPRKCPKPCVVVIADDIVLYDPQVYQKGMAVITVPTRRVSVDSLNPRVKSLNYLNNILAKIEGYLQGYPEVLMLNPEGYVLEGTGDNIFLVKRGRVITPPAYQGILEGITRAVVIDLLKEMGVEVEFTPITRHDVYVADEVFLTGTAAEVVPVVNADSRVIGEGVPGDLTRRLLEAFRDHTQVSGTPIY